MRIEEMAKCHEQFLRVLDLALTKRFVSIVHDH